jgi:hypothetical protein
MPIQPNAEIDAYVADDDIDARPEQTASGETNVLSGWDAADSLTSPSGDFPTEVKFEDGKHLVFKFLDEKGPFAIYKQHFLKQKTSGKRSYVWDGSGAEDPLSAILDSRPENKRAFTVVNLSHPESMQRQMLITGARLYQALHAAHYSPQGPLTKGFWAIVRLGKGPTTVYTVTPIKERDLEEDWNINPERAAAVIAVSEPYTANVIKTHSYDELKEIAESLL